MTSLGVAPTSTCQCAAKQAEYNRNGLDWCKANREAILAHLRGAYSESTLLTKLRAGANAVGQGMPWSVEGILEMAIERADIAIADKS